MKKIMIDLALIDHLARLSALRLSEDEKKKYLNQLQETINYVENLKELETHLKRIKSFTRLSKNRNFIDGTNNNRSLSLKELASFCHLKSNYFRVKKIF